MGGLNTQKRLLFWTPKMWPKAGVPRKLVSFDQIWSHLIRFDQIWSDLTRFDQILTTFDHIWSRFDHLINSSQIWSILIRSYLSGFHHRLSYFKHFLIFHSICFDQIWSDLIRFDQIWSDLISWSNLIKSDQIWSNLVKSDEQTFSTVSKGMKYTNLW